MAGAPAAPTTPAPRASAQDGQATGRCCRVWLPDIVLPAGERLKVAIEGADGGNFMHLRRKHPGALFRVFGKANLSLPPWKRLQVVAQCQSTVDLDKVERDVMDLAETACDIVADSLGLTDDEVQQAFEDIRVERSEIKLAATKPAVAAQTPKAGATLKAQPPKPGHLEQSVEGLAATPKRLPSFGVLPGIAAAGGTLPPARSLIPGEALPLSPGAGTPTPPAGRSPPLAGSSSKSPPLACATQPPVHLSASSTRSAGKFRHLPPPPPAPGILEVAPLTPAPAAKQQAPKQQAPPVPRKSAKRPAGASAQEMSLSMPPPATAPKRKRVEEPVVNDITATSKSSAGEVANDEAPVKSVAEKAEEEVEEEESSSSDDEEEEEEETTSEEEEEDVDVDATATSAHAQEEQSGRPKAPARIKLFKLGELCCEVVPSYAGGRTEPETLPRKLQIDQRTKLEHCKQHLDEAGDLVTVWLFTGETQKQAKLVNTLSEYFKTKQRVGLVALPACNVYVVPTEASFLQALGLPPLSTAAAEVGGLLALQLPVVDEDAEVVAEAKADANEKALKAA